jgi:hypothetical protein
MSTPARKRISQTQKRRWAAWPRSGRRRRCRRRLGVGILNEQRTLPITQCRLSGRACPHRLRGKCNRRNTCIASFSRHCFRAGCLQIVPHCTDTLETLTGRMHEGTLTGSMGDSTQEIWWAFRTGWGNAEAVDYRIAVFQSVAVSAGHPPAQKLMVLGKR